MASCSGCGNNVGCACALVNGLCAGCLAKNANNSLSKTFVEPSVNTLQAPTTDFNIILNQSGLTKEEKLKRINDILEKARLEYANNLQITGS